MFTNYSQAALVALSHRLLKWVSVFTLIMKFISGIMRCFLHILTSDISQENYIYYTVIIQRSPESTHLMVE